ncbi:hypothetical protein OHV08_00845 [Streptomyces canus]|uniref:hypothetical protein n=1 Tax=Streptomyces canus TaxID=58343 RepID=UPI003243EBAC
MCGERLTRTWLISTVTAVTGCALLMAPTGTGVDALGLLAATASGVCYDLYTVYAKQLATDHPGVHLPTVSALSLLLGAVRLVPWMAADTATLGQPATLGLIARLGPATTALAYWLFSAASPPPARRPWAPSASPNPSRPPSSASSSCTSTSPRPPPSAAC